MAQLSDHLFTATIVAYGLALVAYCGEYALGRQRALVAAPAAGNVTVLERPVRSRAVRAGIIAVGLTVAGAGLHAASIVTRGLAAGRLPWGNMYEFSSAVGLVAVLALLVTIARRPALRHLGMFALLPVVVLLFLAGTVLYAPAGDLVPALRSYWLAIHVTLAITATGSFVFSGIVTMLYLVRAKWEKLDEAGVRPARFPLTIGWRLPDSALLDHVAYRTVTFAFPIWTVAICTGAIWAEAAWGRYWNWDPKETWAFIAWVIYSAYLHARATGGWRGNAAAAVNLLGLGAMLFNFLFVNIVISGLHSYAGLT